MSPFYIIDVFCPSNEDRFVIRSKTIAMKPFDHVVPKPLNLACGMSLLSLEMKDGE